MFFAGRKTGGVDLSGRNRRGANFGEEFSGFLSKGGVLNRAGRFDSSGLIGNKFS